MVLNSLFPVFALIVLGTLLKHYHLTGDAFFNRKLHNRQP